MHLSKTPVNLIRNRFEPKRKAIIYESPTFLDVKTLYLFRLVTLIVIGVINQFVSYRQALPLGSLEYVANV